MNTALLSPSDANATLALLRTRMKERGNLPSFGKVIRAITEAMHCEDEAELSMTQTVLADPALTQQVLRLANSAMYSAFGQRANTVTKAVMILGTEAIGHLALSMKLIDNLAAASPDSESARAELEKAVVAGQMVREVTAAIGKREDEEAVVCSMLHGLGRIMVAFYLPDHWAAMQKSGASPDNDSAREILGLGLDELSEAIATQWSLPKGLVATLRDASQTPSGPTDRAGYLSALSTMMSICADAVVTKAATPTFLAGMANDYAAVLGIEPSALHAAIASASAAAANVNEEKGKSGLDDETVSQPEGTEGAPSPADILKQGIAEMQGGLAQSSTGQLVTMALETMHRAFGGNHAIAFLRNRKEQRYAAKTIIGTDPHQRMSGIAFQEQFAPDVFHAALVNDKVILVQNARDAGFADRLPGWWHGTMTAVRSFIIVPLVAGNHPVGLLYCDCDNGAASGLPDQTAVGILDDMRKLIVDALLERF